MARAVSSSTAPPTPRPQAFALMLCAELDQSWGSSSRIVSSDLLDSTNKMIVIPLNPSTMTRRVMQSFMSDECQWARMVAWVLNRAWCLVSVTLASYQLPICVTSGLLPLHSLLVI